MLAVSKTVVIDFESINSITSMPVVFTEESRTISAAAMASIVPSTVTIQEMLTLKYILYLVPPSPPVSASSAASQSDGLSN